MEIELVIADLKYLYDDAKLKARSINHLEDRDIDRWSTLLGISRSCLYDEIASYLARKFHNWELAFEFCDAVVNGLYSVILLFDEQRPALFWKIFLAFEEGESYHDDNRD